MYFSYPVVVLPNFLQNISKKRYCNYGGNISKKEIESAMIKISNKDNIKHIVCFIGGFFDTYYKVLWNAFAYSIKSKDSNIKVKNICINSNDTSAFYISFNCFDFLHDFIPKLNNNGYIVSVIAHSWGAKNILRLCLKYNLHLENLITLDCVGHFNITHRPSNIITWENIYISDYFCYYNRANLAAIIGGAKQYIAYADFNIKVYPPANHASVSTMLSKSKLINIGNM